MTHGTKVDGVFLSEFEIVEKPVQKNTHLLKISAVKNMISYLSLYDPEPSAKDLRGIEF